MYSSLNYRKNEEIEYIRSSTIDGLTLPVCNVNIVHGESSKLFSTTGLYPTYAEGKGALISTEVLFSTPVIQLLINKDRKSQFHIKELFFRGISFTAELICPKESVFRNRVPTTMNFLKLQSLNSRVQCSLNVYWNGKELLGYPAQNFPSGSFLFFEGGGVAAGGNSKWLCVNGMSQKDTLDNVAYTCMLLYPIDVSHLSFNFLCLLLL